MVIFDKSGVITPEMDKTNISFDFDVPQGVSKLDIDFSYSPKTAEDDSLALNAVSASLEKYLGAENDADPHSFLPVNNLVTVSLDDPEGYRGAAHRQPCEQHIVIGSGCSSPGFLKNSVQSGKWRIILNVHCCVCNISYSLKISGGEEK